MSKHVYDVLTVAGIGRVDPGLTLREWRADALARGGVPKPEDADPQVRYLANRIERLTAALLALLDDEDAS